MLELCVKVKLYSKHHALAKVNVMKYLVFIFFSCTHYQQYLSARHVLPSAKAEVTQLLILILVETAR